MPIHKLTITVTVLAEMDTLAEAVETYSHMDLEQIGVAIDGGEDIGSVNITNAETVPDERVRDELLAIGNDGSFFPSTTEHLEPDGPRIIATFHPQAWQNEYAIDVDPEGPVTADLTEPLSSLSREELLALRNDRKETDVLRHLKQTPRWWAEWSGPFYISVEDSIRDYLDAMEGRE